MSDSVHFHVLACCKRLDGTARERGKAKGLAGTSPRFPRLLTSRGGDKIDSRGGATVAGHGLYYMRV